MVPKQTRSFMNSPSSYSEVDSLSTTTFPHAMDVIEPLPDALFSSNIGLYDGGRTAPTRGKR